MLTSRERLRRCFYHQETDRPGVYVRRGLPARDPSYDGLWRLIRERTDQKIGWGIDRLLPPLPIEKRTERYSDDFEREVRTLRTPRGELVSTYLYGLKGQPGMTERHFVNSAAEAETYLSLPMREPVGSVEEFFRIDKEIGDAGIVDVSLGLNPAGFVAEALLGSENLAEMSVTDRDVMHALCERQMKTQLRLLDHALSRGVGPFFSMLGQEYVSPPLHGPGDFADFNTRYDKPLIDRVHEAGGRVHVHCHGRVGAVLEQFLAMGVDVLHPIEPPPMGDVTARQAKERLRGRVCIEGNIQIADMYDRTPEEVREQTRRLIDDAWDDRRGLIVCPTASPWIIHAGDRCLPRFAAMVDEVNAAARLTRVA